MRCQQPAERCFSPHFPFPPRFHTNPLSMIGSQKPHVLILIQFNFNSSPLSFLILDDKPRIVLYPSAFSTPFAPTLLYQAPPGQPRRHPTAATLTKQATLLILQPWAQAQPYHRPIIRGVLLRTNQDRWLHILRLTRQHSPEVSCRPVIRQDWLGHY